ncbi:hypothetical protein BaRGS_00030282 [Batillaria attramentaria]|uniref:arylamine N-acetyltransferase n=1 Tax=Batillaria attramentaria TaxID=370345 RepID=A0ABD0JUS6_9CAEN
MSAMFTKQEAVEFLQMKWGVERVEERLLNDRRNLLEEVTVLIQTQVPFQSITLMATPPEQRRRPSVETIKRECMAGIGGLCYNLNVFGWGLLKALGYSVQLCPATCTSTVTSPDNHVVILLNNLENDGDLHLLEFGVGFPTFRAVSLNFEQESPVFVDSFLEYKYIRHKGQFLRMHGKGDVMKRNNPPIEGLDFIVDRWRRFYYFTIRPTDNLSDFDASFDRVFAVPCVTPFDRSPRALCFPGKRAVILVNNRLMLEHNGELHTTVLEGDEDIVAKYRQHFPIFSEEMVCKAIKQWHEVSKQC